MDHPPKQEAAAAPTTTNDNSSSSGSAAPKAQALRLSCTKCFDALWFCYSPFHQMQQYYRYGEFDNCFGKWNALFDCLSLKTKKVIRSPGDFRSSGEI
ncbi:uncharacterized protein C227.17c-like isoform X2 [Phoenix dactylifera]|uniref:Uncharacterized protein C227.17c-like isoform X2 n=1 Tax=Phoenix dactylifera TaxID=42345 RepID=A0A8B8J0D3_PHODC|nr:uncharacterized protein C227.17c-like isoform X2 [Phoenix dactylifera]